MSNLQQLADRFVHATLYSSVWGDKWGVDEDVVNEVVHEIHRSGQASAFAHAVYDQLSSEDRYKYGFSGDGVEGVVPAILRNRLSGPARFRAEDFLAHGREFYRGSSAFSYFMEPIVDALFDYSSNGKKIAAAVSLVGGAALTVFAPRMAMWGFGVMSVISILSGGYGLVQAMGTQNRNQGFSHLGQAVLGLVGGVLGLGGAWVMRANLPRLESQATAWRQSALGFLRKSEKPSVLPESVSPETVPPNLPSVAPPVAAPVAPVPAVPPSAELVGSPLPLTTPSVPVPLEATPALAAEIPPAPCRFLLDLEEAARSQGEGSLAETLLWRIRDKAYDLFQGDGVFVVTRGRHSQILQLHPIRNGPEEVFRLHPTLRRPSVTELRFTTLEGAAAEISFADVAAAPSYHHPFFSPYPYTSQSSLLKELHFLQAVERFPFLRGVLNKYDRGGDPSYNPKAVLDVMENSPVLARAIKLAAEGPAAIWVKWRGDPHRVGLEHLIPAIETAPEPGMIQVMAQPVRGGELRLIPIAECGEPRLAPFFYDVRPDSPLVRLEQAFEAGKEPYVLIEHRWKGVMERSLVRASTRDMQRNPLYITLRPVAHTDQSVTSPTYAGLECEVEAVQAVYSSREEAMAAELEAFARHETARTLAPFLKEALDFAHAHGGEVWFRVKGQNRVVRSYICDLYDLLTGRNPNALVAREWNAKNPSYALGQLEAPFQAPPLLQKIGLPPDWDKSGYHERKWALAQDLFTRLERGEEINALYLPDDPHAVGGYLEWVNPRIVRVGKTDTHIVALADGGGTGVVLPFNRIIDVLPAHPTSLETEIAEQTLVNVAVGQLRDILRRQEGLLFCLDDHVFPMPPSNLRWLLNGLDPETAFNAWRVQSGGVPHLLVDLDRGILLSLRHMELDVVHSAGKVLK